MAMFHPSVFRAYDVRGVYPKDFDAAFLQQLGSRVAAWLKRGPIVVGRDIRASSDELAYAVIDGAMHVGAQVIDIGRVSSPQCYWAIRELGAVGGMMITASHNPGDYNGLKVIKNDQGALHVVGGDHLRQVYDSHEYVHHANGSLQGQDIIPGYAAAVAKAAGWSDQALQLSIDGPEPVRRGLELISPIAPDHGLAAKFDPDGDRIMFFDHGAEIAADWIFLALTEYFMLEPVVFDLTFSRAVHEQLRKIGTPFRISPVGRLAMNELMGKGLPALGAEMSGHYYWREFGGMECPELVLLRMVKLIQAHNTTLTGLIDSYRRYHKSEVISIPVRDRKAAWSAIRHLAKHFSDGKTSDLDGLSIDYPDWWFNIRPSNTEPLLRMVVEAKEKDLFDQKIAEIRSALS